MNGFVKVLYRPTACSPGVPFGLRSVGRSRLVDGDVTEKLLLDFIQLVWAVSGEGRALIDGEEQVFKAGFAACYHHGARHQLVNPGRMPWECRWITLDGPDAERFIRSFGYSRMPFPAGDCPMELFDRLEDAIRRVGPEGARQATLPAYELLLRAVPPQGTNPRPPGARSPFEEKAMDFVAASLSNSAIGVSQIAGKLGMSRNRFAAKFKAATGSSPKDYIMTARLQKALSLIKGTELSIAEVAHSCGFSTPNYFARFFVEKMGMTPSAFRKVEGCL